MPLGNPEAYAQPDAMGMGAEPQNLGGLQLTPELMNMILELLSSLPQSMGTEPSIGQAAGTVPAMAQAGSEQELELQVLMQQLMNPAQQMANGPAGMAGGMYGHLGGRPPGL